jgi:hypothetical protein
LGPASSSIAVPHFVSGLFAVQEHGK